MRSNVDRVSLQNVILNWKVDQGDQVRISSQPGEKLFSTRYKAKSSFAIGGLECCYGKQIAWIATAETPESDAYFRDLSRQSLSWCNVSNIFPWGCFWWHQFVYNNIFVSGWTARCLSCLICIEASVKSQCVKALHTLKYFLLILKSLENFGRCSIEVCCLFAMRASGTCYEYCYTLMRSARNFVCVREQIVTWVCNAAICHVYNKTFITQEARCQFLAAICVLCQHTWHQEVFILLVFSPAEGSCVHRHMHMPRSLCVCLWRTITQY